MACAWVRTACCYCEGSLFSTGELRCHVPGTVGPVRTRQRVERAGKVGGLAASHLSWANTAPVRP